MQGQNIRTFHKSGGWFASLPAWFGIACLLLATAVSSAAATFTTQVNFNGIDGSEPALEALVQGTDGNFYGTTLTGGIHGDGTVFQMTPAGTLTTIYNFAGLDGAFPKSGLVMGDAGTFFYGTTNQGGAHGFGTVFKITSGGVLTTLHNFAGTDGEYPTAALVEGTSHSFYGTTNGGGAFGLGTVFKITSTGALKTIHSFGGAEGEYPIGGLIQGTDRKFYGTTSEGGTMNRGTVFKITSGGVLTLLCSFTGGNGEYPYATLVQATDGHFYGTTYMGGFDNLGTIFEVTSGGTLAVIHDFGGFDGEYPTGALVQATDGYLYGTADGGGSGSLGTAFEVTLGGTLTTLHSFAGADGENPVGGMLQGTAGDFFGTTNGGGSGGQGTVFNLSTGLGPFVKTLPTSGKVGAAVTILGSSLTGTTSVYFGGISASFAVVSDSEITTYVPAGATTGPVDLGTPGGNLTSNVKFVVR